MRSGGMHVTICALRLFVWGCILQCLDAAVGEEKLPFEVDVNSDAVDFGNVGLDKRVSAGNRLTWQTSKQGENFVDSPKPANTQGFSFDAEPPSETISTPSIKKMTPTHSVTASSPKLTKTPTASSAASGVNPVGAKHRHSGAHSFWQHFPSWSSTSFGYMNPFSPGFPFGRSSPFDKVNFPVGKSDPFKSNLKFGKSDPFDSEFLFGKSNPFDSLFPFYEPDSIYSDFPYAKTNPSGFGFPEGDWRSFGSRIPFNDYDFQPPAMPSIGDMKLVEDRILDDENGKGRFRTYKSKDGNAMVHLLHRKGELGRNSNRVGQFRQQGERRSFRRPHSRRSTSKN